MSPTLPRTASHILASVVITLSIFAMPLWTVSSHAPVALLSTEAHTDAPPEPVYFVAELPPEPAPEPILEAEPEPEPERAPEPPPPQPAAVEPAPLPVADSTPEAPAALPEGHPPPPPGARIDPSSAPALADAAPPKKKHRRKRRNCRPDVPEIEASGRNQWTVARDLVDQYARDLDAAARLAFVGWARDDNDRIVGFKVHKVRCGSPLHEAGFEDGDVITRINGHKVRSVPQALAAYVALRVKRRLRVRGHRKDGTPLDHRYRLT